MKKNYIKPSMYAKHILKFSILAGSPNAEGSSSTTPEGQSDLSGSTEKGDGTGMNEAKGGLLFDSEW